ncbi:MAG: SRPBCC domain-containing protein [Labilithrix sp.]|nr:SRPBCC domain-containing protein [Labilithrix sp.]
MAARGKSNEIRLTRVYDAPVRAVWDAWTIPEQVEKWWGPRGFTLTTHSKDLRAGGTWRYTMHGPDGVDHPNVTKYLVVEPYEKLVYDHGGTDERPALFRVTVTFTEDGGKTTMEMISTLPSPEAAMEMAKFIKQAGGNATWDRLAEHLEQTATGTQSFVVNRTFDAPIARVFEMWTSPDHLVKWLPPAGTEMRFFRSEIAPGKSTFFVIAGAKGATHVRVEYLAIEPPRRIVYTQQFVDERERLAPAPGAESWPPTLRTTVLLTEEAPDRTRVTVTSQPHEETTVTEVEAFVRERPGMTLGWNGSFEALEALLDPNDAASGSSTQPRA